MRILFYVPHLNTIYAGRTIYSGYKHAFEEMGHDFRFLTADDNQKSIYAEFRPDILFSSISSYVLKFLDLALLKEQKMKGMKVFVNTPFWKSPISRLRINETPSLSDRRNFVELIKSGNFGDVYYNVCQPEDARMDGFEATTGYKHHTVPLGVDTRMHFPEYSERFSSDISFLGTNLPDKRKFFQEYVYPLGKEYDLNLYGQDWTSYDRALGMAQKIGQYFNIPLLKKVQRPKFDLEDERRIYSSAKISLNVHENYQRRFGGDCNERTFKIPACGGFEVTDDVACIRKYFRDGEEIVIAKDKKDWYDKIDYYMKNPDKRSRIVEAGRLRVLKDHTYKNRVNQFIEIYNSL